LELLVDLCFVVASKRKPTSPPWTRPCSPEPTSRPALAKVTVGEYAPVWMATKVNLKPKTRAGYESLLEAQIQPRWSKAPLSGVTYGAASAWVAQMVADGLRRHARARRTNCSAPSLTTP